MRKSHEEHDDHQNGAVGKKNDGEDRRFLFAFPHTEDFADHSNNDQNSDDRIKVSDFHKLKHGNAGENDEQCISHTEQKNCNIFGVFPIDLVIFLNELEIIEE